MSKNQAHTLKMPIHASPYAHQQQAYDFALRLFGMSEGGDSDSVSVRTCIHNLLSSVWKCEIFTMASAEATEIS